MVSHCVSIVSISTTQDEYIGIRQINQYIFEKAKKSTEVLIYYAFLRSGFKAKTT